MYAATTEMMSTLQAERNVNGSLDERLSSRFQSALERHVRQLRIIGDRATGCCPFHDDRHPSFSANIKKGCFHCFACGASGGVKKFAELLGEPWSIVSLPRQERKRITISLRRAEAERQARAILQRRRDEKLDEIFNEWREIQAEAADALDLLHVFHRWPHLAEAFSNLAALAEREYSKAMLDRAILDARMDGELL